MKEPGRGGFSDQMLDDLLPPPPPQVQHVPEKKKRKEKEPVALRADMTNGSADSTTPSKKKVKYQLEMGRVNRETLRGWFCENI